MNIVQKRDIFFGHWVDVLHAQHGHVALECYQTMEKREADDFYATDPRAERCPNCVSRISYLRRHKPHDCHGATDRPALNNRQSAAHHSDNRCAADGKAQRTARRSAAHRTKG